MAVLNGVFIDDILAKSIPRFQHEVLKKDRDKHLLVDGREGTGKSMLAMQLAKALDPNFNIDKIAFNAEQFIKLAKDPARKKGDCILLDEAFSSASARSSLSHINKAMITLATEMRQLNLFVIIVLPSYFDLDKYFAIWRCDTLFHVYFNKQGSRGQYVIFPFKKKLKLYINGKKMYNYNIVKSPYPPCHFNKQWVIDETEYRTKKAKAFRERKTSLMEKVWKDRALRAFVFLNNQAGFTCKQIADVVQMKEENVMKALQIWTFQGGKVENILNATSEDSGEDGQ